MAPPTISIHALLAESDTIFAVRPYDAPIFLSTLSLRRATNVACGDWHELRDFYPRSPCGERPYQGGTHHEKSNFYPRSPCGERRVFNLFANPGSTISIHALLAESDISCAWSASKLGDFYPRSPCGERREPTAFRTPHQNFYPRSPCGERLMYALILAKPMLFLSTLSLRRATP